MQQRDLKTGPIGVFDSGLGGLTVLRELKRAIPTEQCLYLGDTARTPYGTKGEETIVRYARECAQFLQRSNIRLLVVACNTASSYALDILRAECPCPVIGTIDQAVREAVSSSARDRVAVIGTEATIRSSSYQRRIQEVSPQTKVTSIACPLFVPLVEQGICSGEIVRLIIELYLEPVKKEGIDTLILGCTHYPLLSSSIREYLGENVHIVECSKAIAEEVHGLLGDPSNAPQTSSGEDAFFVTDEVARFNELAKLFLGRGDVSAQKVSLFE